jgi:hypothetical protein
MQVTGAFFINLLGWMYSPRSYFEFIIHPLTRSIVSINRFTFLDKYDHWIEILVRKRKKLLYI